MLKNFIKLQTALLTKRTYAAASAAATAATPVEHGGGSRELKFTFASPNNVIF
jgi:hypothetical protein